MGNKEYCQIHAHGLHASDVIRAHLWPKTQFAQQAFFSLIEEAFADFHSEHFIAETSFSLGVTIYQTRALSISTVPAMTYCLHYMKQTLQYTNHKGNCMGIIDPAYCMNS